MDLNISPYYDDYDATKNYLRILFTPGRPVQARELTQAYSILQNQIGAHASHIFKDGTAILNGKIAVDSYRYVLNVTVPADIATFTVGGNVVVSGESATKSAVIQEIDAVNGKLYIDGFSPFAASDVITDVDTTNTATLTASNQIHATIQATLEDGIVYVAGNFVTIPAQESVTVDDSGNTGSYSIGYLLSEEIVQWGADSSLLDNAIGSPNENAPGADRYKASVSLSSYTLAAVKPDNFYEVIRIVDGSIVKDQSNTEYAELMRTLARRTFDESGNYTTDEFVIEMKSNVNPAYITAELDSGKAYVKGFEIEKPTSSTIDIKKATDTKIVSGESIYADIGPYFTIEKSSIVGGLFDLSTQETIYFLDGASARITESDAVTELTARVLTIFEDSSSDNVRVYLSDFSDELYSLFSICRSIENSASSKTADLTLYRETVNGVVEVLPRITNKDKNLLIFKSRGEVLQTVTNTQYSYVKYDTAITGDVSNDYFVTAPINSRVENDIVIVDNTGAVIDPSTYTFSASAGDGLPATYNIPAAPTSIDVIVEITTTTGIAKTKTLTVGQTILATGAGETSLTLNHIDIVELTSVDAGAGNLLPDDTIILDNGQRDTLYDYGVVSGLTASTSYTIDYTYYAHSGAGNYFNIDSYPTYDTVAAYKAANTSEYQLRDCVDYRRSMTEITTGVITISPDDFIQLDYVKYLPRIDKIYLDQYGSFGVVEGVSSENPVPPQDLDNAMSLYSINVNAYTYDETDSTAKLIDNKNYTMRDIGRIDRRLQTVEYNYALNLLEQQAIGTDITDSNGLSKYKNGILVDNFVGHIASDVDDSEYSCAIDSVNRVLRPEFTVDQSDLDSTDNTATQTTNNVVEHDSTITLLFTTSALIEQDLSSESMNINPYGIYSWNGSLKLSPNADNWVSTSLKPVIVSNENGENDGWKSASGFTNKWNFWNDMVWGSDNTATVKTKEGKWITATTFKQIGDRTVNTTVVPFIRARTITWNAVGMRPGVTVVPYFDNIDVTAAVTPTAGSLGDPIVVGTDGTASGTFAITDEWQFRVGDRLFELKDSDESTSAEAVYTANGIDRVVTRTMSVETRTWKDPLAQSFLVGADGGTFIESIDIFFKTLDPNGTPVTVMIVENDNGFPTQKTVRYGEVNVVPTLTSVDGSVATNFKFGDPVYLEDGREYSFVVLSNSNKYEIFVAKLGELDLISGIGIAKQPYAGVMFKSQNSSTWTPDQERDIKFTMNKCDFVTGINGIYNMDNAPSAVSTNTLNISVDHLNFNSTSVSSEYNLNAGAYNLYSDKANIDFGATTVINTIGVKISLSTLNANVSPVVSKNSASTILLKNNFGIGAPSKYITKTVNLINPSDDIKVIADIDLDAGTSVNAYYRTESLFVPKRISYVIPNPDASLVGDKLTLYEATNNAGGYTAVNVVGTATVTEIDTNNLYVYLKDISDESVFTSAADNLIMSSDNVMPTAIPAFAAATAYNIGDYIVFTDSLIYVAVQEVAADESPSTNPTKWEEVLSFKTDKAGVTTDSSSQWRGMSVEFTRDLENGDVEYQFEPTAEVDNEFTSFAVKLELTTTSSDSAYIPIVKNFKTIAVY